MRSAWALILVAAAAVAAAGCAGAHARRVGAPLSPQGQVRADIAAARASDPSLFVLFPQLPAERRCAIPMIEGLRESKLQGRCRTSISHPVTHGRYPESFVTFRESWGHRYSSWTLIVQRPAEKVVATQLRGEPAPQLRYAATDGVANVVELTKSVPCAGSGQRTVGPQTLRRFHAVTAVSCVEQARTYPGQGQWWVRIRRVARGGVARLQRYFEQRNEPSRPKGGGCILVARIILVPTFVDRSGHWSVPRTPVDGCGEPLAGYGPLERAVRWRVVSVQKLRLLVSAAALAARCAMTIKNEAAGAAGELGPSSGGPLFGTAPTTVRICIYRTGDALQVGRFVRGFRLGASRTRRLLGALTGATPSGGCRAQRTFAVIVAKVAAEVELGGCWRVSRPNLSGMGSADAAVAGAILDPRAVGG